MTNREEVIGVVGAGIVGLAVARRIQEVRPASRVVVLEKETAVAQHQTGHNSGVVHAGVYYTPGSLKAELCRSGAQLLRSYCEEKALPFSACGKLVVASRDSELPALREIERRALANGVPRVRWLSASDIHDVEPHVRGVAALHSPTTAITDFAAISASLAQDIRDAGGTVCLGANVVSTRPEGARIAVSTHNSGQHLFQHLVVCAGLHSDRLARGAGCPREPSILPFRGEYLRLRPERVGLIRGLVYPVPDPAYPFLGVHFTRRIDGSVDVGPNAVLATAREGYRRRDISIRDLREMMRDRAFWSIARQHWRAGITEGVGSASRRVFVQRANQYVPALEVSDVVSGPAGVRAQAVGTNGDLVDDFVIQHVGRVTAVRNAPSPAATSAFAIARRIVDEVTLS